MALTLERVREVLELRDDGILYWRISRGCVKPGTPAGTLYGGILHIKIDGHIYLSNRLISFYKTGMWPPIHREKKEFGFGTARNSKLPGEKMETISICIRPSILKQVTAAAEKKGISRSLLISNIIEHGDIWQ